MTGRYLVGGQPSCTGAAYQGRAGTAAARWLAALRKVTRDQPPVLTPYANVDMAALVRQGLTRDLATAYRTGEAVANSVLHGTFGHAVAWPPGGTADLSVLTYLAAAQHVGTVVLNSSEMPPVNADNVFRPERRGRLAEGRGPADERAAVRQHADRDTRGRQHELRHPAGEHRVRRPAAVPARDRDDRRRGPRFQAHDRGGPAGRLEPVEGARQRPARRDRDRPLGDTGPAGQPELGAGHRTRGAPAAAFRPARRARASSAPAT